MSDPMVIPGQVLRPMRIVKPNAIPEGGPGWKSSCIFKCEIISKVSRKVVQHRYQKYLKVGVVFEREFLRVN